MSEPTAQANTASSGSVLTPLSSGAPLTAIRGSTNSVVKPTLFDLDGLDLSRTVADRQTIGRQNPHRDHLALLDSILWHSADYKQGVAVWHVKPTEFWVSGHFPGRPLLPGVLQLEAGAQLGVWLYNSRYSQPKLAAFTRIDDAVFRGQVVPGDDLYLLADEIKVSERRFESLIQGVVGGKVVFDGRIQGISLGVATV